MKKLLAIVLGIVYLTISIGFPVSVHKCNSAGETSLNLGHSNHCECQVAEVKSCCSEEKDIKASSCHYIADSKPCCTFESHTVVWESDQQLHSENFGKIQIKELILYQKEPVIDFEEKENFIHFFDLNPPPQKSVSFTILQNQFVFCG